MSKTPPKNYNKAAKHRLSDESQRLESDKVKKSFTNLDQFLTHSSELQSETVETHSTMGSASKEELKAMLKEMEESIVKRLDAKIDKKLDVIPQVLKCQSEMQSSLRGVQSELREKNIIMHGLPANSSETKQDLLKTVSALFKAEGLNPDIDDLYRIRTFAMRGGGGHTRPGPVIVKFLRSREKEEVMKKRKIFAEKKIFINDDLPKEEQEASRIARQHFATLKEIDGEITMNYRRGRLNIWKNGATISTYSYNYSTKDFKKS